jgi:hypothetical protein
MQGGGPDWGDDEEEHGPQKENTPLGTAGKGAAAAAAGGGRSARVPWPADAETLLEQEAAGGSATHSYALGCVVAPVGAHVIEPNLLLLRTSVPNPAFQKTPSETAPNLCVVGIELYLL